MTTTDPTGAVEYFLIPLDDAGTYITTAEETLGEKGIASYTQVVQPAGHDLDPQEQAIVQELQSLLPDNVHMPVDNPFLTLQVTIPADSTHGGGYCQCACKPTGSGAGNGRAV